MNKQEQEKGKLVAYIDVRESLPYFVVTNLFAKRISQNWEYYFRDKNGAQAKQRVEVYIEILESLCYRDATRF